MKIEWSTPKIILLILGLISKAFATSPPLPFVWGGSAKAIGAMSWIVFDGLFMYLLRPPKEGSKEDEKDNENS